MSIFLPRTIQAARLITLFIRYAVYYRKCAARTPIRPPTLSTTAPISITPAPPENLPSLHEFFAPGGILSRSSLAFEHRRGQYELARGLQHAFQEHPHLI